jgi:hypothetical protein
MLIALMLSVFMLNVFLLSVVAPSKECVQEQRQIAGILSFSYHPGLRLSHLNSSFSNLGTISNHSPQKILEAIFSRLKWQGQWQWQWQWQWL